MRSLVLESRPELKSMKFNIEMNKADLASSRREYFPDLMIRFTYKNMTQTTPNYWAAMAGVSIPLAPWSSGRYTSKVEENELNVKKAEDDYQSMENMTLYEVQDALVKVQSNQNLASLYKNTVIPQAEQTLESTISAYQTGKTEFLMLIDAYRMVLMSKLDYHMAVMSYMSSQAQLEQAVGMSTAEIKTKVQE
jgi:outer membrane protein TolC